MASRAFDRARWQIDPALSGDRARAVHDVFAVDPCGQPLGELAQSLGLWT